MLNETTALKRLCDLVPGLAQPTAVSLEPTLSVIRPERPETRNAAGRFEDPTFVPQRFGRVVPFSVSRCRNKAAGAQICYRCKGKGARESQSAPQDPDNTKHHGGAAG